MLPCVAYVLAVVTLGDWIIDDAGISFAYARNIAHFDGFVSQAGRPPVEGYSNFTWVMLLVPTFWLHLFHPVIVSKLLGALEVFAFYVLQRTLARRTKTLWLGVVLTREFLLGTVLASGADTAMGTEHDRPQDSSLATAIASTLFDLLATTLARGDVALAAHVADQFVDVLRTSEARTSVVPT